MYDRSGGSYALGKIFTTSEVKHQKYSISYTQTVINAPKAL